MYNDVIEILYYVFGSLAIMYGMLLKSVDCPLLCYQLQI